MQSAETVLSVLREVKHGIVAGEPGDQKWSRRVREGGLGKGPQGTSPRPYLSRPDRREGAGGQRALRRGVPRLRRAHPAAQRQGRRLPVLQALPAWRDQPEMDARARACGDAGVARAVREPSSSYDWSRTHACRRCGGVLERLNSREWAPASVAGPPIRGLAGGSWRRGSRGAVSLVPLCQLDARDEEA